MAEQQLSSPVEQPDRGGSFLFLPVGARPFMTPEKFSEEQRRFWKTGDDFLRSAVLPQIGRLEQKDNALLRDLIARAGEVGLLAVRPGLEPGSGPRGRPAYPA